MRSRREILEAIESRIAITNTLLSNTLNIISEIYKELKEKK